VNKVFGNASSTSGDRDSVARRIVLLLSVFAAVTVGVLAGLLLELRADAIAAREKLMSAFALLVDEQTTRTIQNVRQTLQIADARLSAAVGTGSASEDSIRAEFRELLRDRPFLREIWVLDDRGRIVYDSDANNIGIDLSDRPYFAHHRDHLDSRFDLGAPLRSRQPGGWFIPATRAWRTANGEFSGVIVGAMDPLFFDRVWALDGAIANLTIALIRKDGTLLMRSPFDERAMGLSFAGSPTFSQIRPTSRAGTIQVDSTIDGERRLVAYRRLSAYPDLVIVVGESMGQALAAWWRIVWIVIAGWFVAAIALSGLAAWLIREWKAHRATQDHFRMLFDSNPYSMVLVDRKTLRFLAVNDAAVAQYGWSREEFLAMTSFDIRPPEDVPALMDALSDSALRPGEIIQGHRHRKKDGSVIDVEVVLRMIDFEGRRVALAVATDVTERLRAERARQIAEEQLRQSQERYRMLFETNPYAVAVSDRETQRIVAVNDATVVQYGWSREEFLTLTISDIIVPEDLPAVLAKRQEISTNVSQPIRGLRHRKKDGTIKDVEIVSRVIEYDGRPSVLTIVTDISERLQSERARLSAEEQLRQSQKMEAVGQLTGGIAHDFNNILTVILANADALQEEENLDPGVVTRLDQIADAVQRASDLTRSLLAFSRKAPLNPKPTNVNDLVTVTGKLLNRALGEHVELDSNLADGLWIVDIDPVQLETTLVNLCVNARDAMPGGGKLLIETKNVTLDADYAAQNPEAVPGDYALLTVTDSGTGIPPDVLAKVFDPFFTTKEVGKGTGLGLSMVYGFIKQSNGHIKIYSEVGRGTSFKLYLPRSSTVPQEAARRQSPALPRGTEQILVVEDSPQIREAILWQLQSLGYAVSGAPDGAAGLAVFEVATQPFDLLLTDVVMPGPLTGRALADEVMARWPKTRVVFMSGYSENAIVHQGRLDADVLLLNKPFRKADLAKIVRQALDGRVG
jgi:PAS domain S-box-containing protein